jgi:hypothetical protein
MAHLCGLDEYLDDLPGAFARFDVYQKPRALTNGYRRVPRH